MIKTFADKHSRDLFISGKSRRLPPGIVRRAKQRLEYVHLARQLDDLRVPASNRLHAPEKPMSFKNPNKRLVRPTHPGEFLREDFLPDYDLSVADLANAIKVSRQTVNELINEKRALSAAMALRLSRLFGNSPEFWLNAQRELDLWEAERLHKAELKQIKPATAA
jgi:addiction module HigA family antidote